MILETVGKHAFSFEAAIDEIIVASGKFQAPAVEFEVERHIFAVFDHCDSSEITRPSVVSLYAIYVQAILVRDVAELRLYRFWFGRNDNQILVGSDGFGDVVIALAHFLEHIAPVGACMRPRHQYGILFSPFGR